VPDGCGWEGVCAGELCESVVNVDVCMRAGGRECAGREAAELLVDGDVDAADDDDDDDDDDVCRRGESSEDVGNAGGPDFGIDVHVADDDVFMRGEGSDGVDSSGLELVIDVHVADDDALGRGEGSDGVGSEDDIARGEGSGMVLEAEDCVWLG
jgi:hypothetical protein